ncbi:MAG TPA: hypothetical protein VLF95_01705 [Vicinamibacteria bacterium]|nr:hypothetical protein [Vicinamibacteria bacterium]
MGCGTATPADGRTGADWARAAEGIQMAGIAVFLLLNTTGYLPWSFWLDAIALWPLLVMSAGIRIAFEKTRARWLVLAGPALILGGLAWVASGARPERPAGPMKPQVVERPAGVERVDLDVKLLGARLHVATVTPMPPGRLVTGGSAAAHERTRLEAEADGGVARVRLRTEGHAVPFLPRAKERWDLQLPAELPLRVRVAGAGVGGDLDLATGTVEGLQTDGVFIGVTARLPAPRQQTEIRMKGVFNSFALVVPEGVPVRVHGAGLPFNAVDRGARGEEGRPGYDVHVEGIFSAVDVRRDPAIPVVPPPLPASPPTAPARPPAEAPPSPPAR